MEATAENMKSPNMVVRSIKKILQDVKNGEAMQMEAETQMEIMGKWKEKCSSIIIAKARMTNLVSVTKKRSITLPSGVVDTFTLFIVSSSSQRTSVTSIEERYKKFIVK